MTKKTTIWLDFLNFIVIPFYGLTTIIKPIPLFKTNIINIIIGIVITIYSLICFYFLSKRGKISYYLLMIYLILLLVIGLVYIYPFFDKLIYYCLSAIIISLIWLISNYLYLRKRKVMFHEHGNAHIKKCPGCNRIIPITMTCCGKCNYKEEKHGNNSKRRTN